MPMANMKNQSYYCEADGSLKPKYEEFAWTYVVIGSAAEAYASTHAGVSKSVCYNQGKRLLSEPAIAARVREIREDLAEENYTNARSLLGELEESRVLAREMGQPAAMTSATMGKAKILGLEQQRIDHTSSDGSMTPTVIERVIVMPEDGQEYDA